MDDTLQQDQEQEQELLEEPVQDEQIVTATVALPEEDTAVQSVTEAPVGAEQDAFADQPVASTMRPMLNEKKTPLLPKTEVGSRIVDEKKLDMAAEYDKLAIEYVAGEKFDLQQIKSILTAPNGSEINRKKISQKELESKTGQFSQYLNSALQRELVETSEIAAMLDAAASLSEDPIALEKAAADSILLSAKSNQEFLDRISENPTLEEELKNYLATEVMFARTLAELEESAQSDFDFHIDLLAGLTGIDSLGKIMKWGPNWAEELSNNARAIRNEKDLTKKFEMIQEYKESIKQSMILGKIRRFNPDFVFETASLGLTGSPSDVKTAQALSYLDVAFDATVVFSLLKGGAKGVKGAYALKKELNAANGEEVLEAATKDIANAKDILSVRSPVDMEASQFNKVQKHLNEQAELLARAEQQSVAPVYRNEYQDFPVFDKGNVRTYFFTPDNKATAEFVKQNGNPFASMESAKTRAVQLGIDDYEIVEEKAGFVIKASFDLDAYNAPIAPPKKTSFLGARFNNVSDVINDALHTKVSMAESSVNQISRAVGTVWKRSLGKLSTGARRDFDRVMTQLRDQVTAKDGFNRWFTEDEFIGEFRTLTGNAPSEKVVTAYHSYRQISDFLWRVDNKAELSRLSDENYSGFKFSFSDQSIAAKPVGGLGDDAIILRVENGLEVKSKDLDRDQFDVFQVDSADRFDLQDAGIIPVSGARYIAVPKGQAVAEELNPIRIPYLAGGRVADEAGTYYIKQLNIVDTQSGRVRGRDRTFNRASSKAEAEDFAAKWNRARYIAKPVLDGSSITKELRESFAKIGVGTLDDFIQNAKAKNWDLDQDVVAVANRERIPVESSGIIDNTSDLDLLPEAIGNRFSKRMAERPPHVSPGMDTTFDPMAALANSVNVTARNVSYTTLRRYALEDLKRRFGKYIDVPMNAPLRSYLEAPTNALAVRDGVVNSVEAHQKYISEIVGTKTKDEVFADTQLEKLAKWAFDKDIGPVSGSLLAKKIENRKGFSVSDKARKLLFNTTMGLFNAATTILQASFAPVIAATVPQYGIRSLANYPLFRTMLLGADPTDSSLRKFFSDGAGKVSDALDVKFLGQMDEAVQEFRNLGLDDFSTSTIYADAGVNTNRISLSQGRGGEIVDRVLSAGRIPFNEGELLPRAVSYMAARGRWLTDKTVNPKGLPATSAAGREFIKKTTSKYVFGIDRADIQLGLRGNYTGLVFQFSSYVWRQTAAFLPFNKTFTNAEKFKMAFGSVALFGTGAVPFVDEEIDAVVEKVFGKDIAYAAHQGFFDSVLSLVLGFETQFRDRAQIGKYWSDIWDALTGDRTFMELAVGPAGQTGHRAFDGILNVLKVFSSVSEIPPEDFTKEMAVAVASNISSFNNAYTAALSWDTGVLLSKRGTPLMDVSNAEVVAKIFGIQTSKMAVIGAGFDLDRENKELVNEYRDNILRLQRLMLESVGTPKYEQYKTAIQVVGYSAHQRGIGSTVLNSVANAMKQDDLYSKMAFDMVDRYMQGQEVSPMKLEAIKRIQEQEENNQ
jgi:hypothetical protein